MAQLSALISTDLGQLALQPQGAATIYSGSGVPGAGVGQNGDFYLRTDTPGTLAQRIYIKSGGAWVNALA